MSHSNADVASATESSNLIKGKDNGPPAGTLVEPTNGYLMLLKMNNCTAISAVQGFDVALSSVLLSGRKSMTYRFHEQNSKKS
ncbi:hypothetical protein CES87_01925 [Pseudomonas sp. ERMR1:02]|nr:hypothetical protein CES87_01925 [Pseudomonas sp. ERMR1:02]